MAFGQLCHRCCAVENWLPRYRLATSPTWPAACPCRVRHACLATAGVRSRPDAKWDSHDLFVDLTDERGWFGVMDTHPWCRRCHLQKAWIRSWPPSRIDDPIQQSFPPATSSWRNQLASDRRRWLVSAALTVTPPRLGRARLRSTLATSPHADLRAGINDRRVWYLATGVAAGTIEIIPAGSMAESRYRSPIQHLTADATTG